MKFTQSKILAAGVLVAVVDASCCIPAANADIKAGALDVSQGCIATFNGTANNYTDSVTAGQNYSLPVMNNAYSVAEQVSGPGISETISPNNRASAPGSNPRTISFSMVTNQIVVTFTPIPSNDNGAVSPNNCPIGSTPKAVTLTINPVAAAMPSDVTSSPTISTPNTHVQTPTTTGVTTNDGSVTTPTSTDAEAMQNTGVAQFASAQNAADHKSYLPSTIAFGLAIVLFSSFVAWRSGFLDRVMKRKTT